MQGNAWSIVGLSVLFGVLLPSLAYSQPIARTAGDVIAPDGTQTFFDCGNADTGCPTTGFNITGTYDDITITQADPNGGTEVVLNDGPTTQTLVLSNMMMVNNSTTQAETITIQFIGQSAFALGPGQYQTYAFENGQTSALDTTDFSLTAQSSVTYGGGTSDILSPLTGFDGIPSTMTSSNSVYANPTLYDQAQGLSQCNSETCFAHLTENASFTLGPGQSVTMFNSMQIGSNSSLAAGLTAAAAGGENFPPGVVPEPSTWLLLGSGLACLAAWRRWIGGGMREN